MSKRNNKSKIKISTVLKRVVAVILVMVCMLNITLSNAKADASADSSSANQNLHAGIFDHRNNVGWRVYWIDENGNRISNAYDLIFDGANTSSDYTGDNTRYGDSVSGTKTIQDNWDLPRAMYQDASTQFVANTDLIDKVHNNDWKDNLYNSVWDSSEHAVINGSSGYIYMIMESVWNIPIYYGDVYTGSYYYGTINNIGNYFENTVGTWNWLRNVIQKIACTSPYHPGDFDVPGMASINDLGESRKSEILSGVGIVDYSEMQNIGFGTAIMRVPNKPTDEEVTLNQKDTHTYNGSSTSPSVAPNPPAREDPNQKYNVSIVKVYEDYVNGQTQFNSVKVTAPINPEEIMIEDEANAGYYVAQWDVSSNPFYASGNSWKEITRNSNRINSGNGSTSSPITLSSDKSATVLYVRLVSGTTGNGYGSGNTSIGQSQLTSRIAGASITGTSDKLVYHSDVLLGTPVDSRLTFGAYLSSSKIVESDANSMNVDRTPQSNGFGDFTCKVSIKDLTTVNTVTRTVDDVHKVSAYQTSYSSANSDKAVSLLGLSRESTNSRFKHIGNGVYGSTIDYKINDGSSDRTTSTTSNSNDSSLQSGISGSTGFSIDTYIGNESSSGSQDNSEFENNTDSGYTAKKIDTSVEFVPSVAMTLNCNGYANSIVFMSGNYSRTVNLGTYVGVTYKKINSLSVTSSMFALDNRLTNGDKGWNNKNSVLKYGANYNISGSNEITIEDYQPVELKSGEYVNSSLVTNNVASSNHGDLVSQVESSVSNMELVQYAREITEANYSDSASVMDNNGSSSVDNMSSDTKPDVSESKYWLNANSDGADSSKVNTKVNGTVTSYVKISSDEQGNIYMLTTNDYNNMLNNNIRGNIILNKNQGIDSLSSSSAKEFNNKTNAITNFVNAIERNSGFDLTCPWASTDGRWYNEVASIYYQRNVTTINVGLLYPSNRIIVNGIRMSSNGIEDQGTKAMVSQWTTTAFEADKSSNGVDLSFGNRRLKFNRKYLLMSNKFFVTNMSVSD